MYLIAISILLGTPLQYLIGLRLDQSNGSDISSIGIPFANLNGVWGMGMHYSMNWDGFLMNSILWSFGLWLILKLVVTVYKSKNLIAIAIITGIPLQFFMWLGFQIYFTGQGFEGSYEIDWYHFFKDSIVWSFGLWLILKLVVTVYKSKLSR